MTDLHQCPAEDDDTLTAAQKLLRAYTDDPWDDEEEAEQPKALRKLAALKVKIGGVAIPAVAQSAASFLT